MSNERSARSHESVDSSLFKGRRKVLLLLLHVDRFERRTIGMREQNRIEIDSSLCKNVIAFHGMCTKIAACFG